MVEVETLQTCSEHLTQRHSFKKGFISKTYADVNKTLVINKLYETKWT